MLHKTHAQLCREMPTPELADWLGFFAYDSLREEQRGNKSKLERDMKKRHKGGK